MGEGSHAWLASGATVAASSIGLRITDPRPLLERVSSERYARILGRDAGRRLPEVHIEEPSVVTSSGANTSAGSTAAAASGLLRGRVQRFGDHVDTDAIIPGQFCHLTSLEELGDKAFHFVRPEFVARARAGQTIVVAGEGWGSGSSREQAVWALQGAGIVAVVARSFAFIHKRNLVNEALPYLVVRDPAFYEMVEDGAALTIDLAASEVVMEGGQRFAAHGSSPMILALQREGGLVAAIQRHGSSVFQVVAAG